LGRKSSIIYFPAVGLHIEIRFIETCNGNGAALSWLKTNLSHWWDQSPQVMRMAPGDWSWFWKKGGHSTMSRYMKKCSINQNIFVSFYMKIIFLENKRGPLLWLILQTNFKEIHNASKKKWNSIKSTSCKLCLSSSGGI